MLSGIFVPEWTSAGTWELYYFWETSNNIDYTLFFYKNGDFFARGSIFLIFPRKWASNILSIFLLTFLFLYSISVSIVWEQIIGGTSATKIEGATFIWRTWYFRRLGAVNSRPNYNWRDCESSHSGKSVKLIYFFCLDQVEPQDILRIFLIFGLFWASIFL